MFDFPGLSYRTLRRSRRAGVTAILTAFTSVLLGTLAVPSLAQLTPEDDTISVTYQSADGGVETVTEEVAVDPGTGVPTASALIPDAEYSAQGNTTASLDDGSAFVVTPTIDPELQLFYRLTNLTTTPLTSLTFTLESADGFYFENPPLSRFTPRSSRFIGSFADGILGSNNRFRSLIFSLRNPQDGGIAFGQLEEFSFAIMVPGTIGRNYGVQLRPNGGRELPLAIAEVSAPEPGSVFLFAAGAVCLPIAGIRFRRRSLRRRRNGA